QSYDYVFAASSLNARRPSPEAYPSASGWSFKGGMLPREFSTWDQPFRGTGSITRGTMSWVLLAFVVVVFGHRGEGASEKLGVVRGWRPPPQRSGSGGGRRDRTLCKQ